MGVNFLTSGFPDGLTDEFIAELKPFFPPEPSFVFVASDFAAHEKTERYFEHFLHLFGEKGVRFSNARIVDFRVSPDGAARLIKNAGVVWLCGGDTLRQMAHIREYGLEAPLKSRDGITIGMSAGAINMAARVVLARDENDNVPELSVYGGIGLVDINIEPHINQAGARHLEDVREAAKIAPIYGLHDGAFIKERGGAMELFGAYVLFDERREKR